MRRFRVAIVGTGNIAHAHLDALRAMGTRVEVVAAVDVDPARVEAFRAAHDLSRAYTDTGAMLAAEVPDLVQICTPPAAHADLSVACLRAGAAVLCEKPLCGSLAELDRIAAAAAETGRSCSTVAQWRFGAGGQHLKGLIASGALGRPLVGLCQTTWFRDAAYYAVPWRGTWASELGGTTLGHGIHAIDFFLWQFGDWEEVSAMLGTFDRAIEVENVSLAIVRFAGGALGSIVNSALSPRQESRLRFDFGRATVELTHLYRYSNADWRFTPLDSAGGVTGADASALAARWAALPPEVPSLHAAQLAATLDSLERGERPPVGLEEARRTLEFVTALYKSAFTGQPVRRGTIGPGDPFYARLNGASGAAPIDAAR